MAQHVVIAGGHGQIARRLGRQLVARGVAVTGLIRNPDQAGDLGADGITPVVCDLESATPDEVAAAVDGAGALVFAAGAGPNSGPARKATMDRDGAIAFLRAGDPAAPFVIVSSVGAQSPPDDDSGFSAYLRAKAAADQAVIASAHPWTVLRPGPLTNDPGTGQVLLTQDPHRGDITRDDVAAVITALLLDAPAPHRIIYAAGGSTPVVAAVTAIANAAPRAG